MPQNRNIIMILTIGYAGITTGTGCVTIEQGLCHDRTGSVCVTVEERRREDCVMIEHAGIRTGSC